MLNAEIYTSFKKSVLRTGQNSQKRNINLPGFEYIIILWIGDDILVSYVKLSCRISNLFKFSVEFYMTEAKEDN
jgi:hypothetical protein